MYENTASASKGSVSSDAYAAQITECDGKLQQWLGALKGHALPEVGLGTPKRGTPAKNSVRFDARTSLFEASGVDLTRIPGIDTSTALKVISQIGVDLARFPSVKHFTSWLGLCPGTKISGGKVLSSATKPCANRAAQALRMAAQALRKSQTALGARHRRLCSRMDKPKAITASAHKLARLVYFMLTKGQSFVEAGQDRTTMRSATVKEWCKISPVALTSWDFNLHHSKPPPHDFKYPIFQDCWGSFLRVQK